MGAGVLTEAALDSAFSVDGMAAVLQQVADAVGAEGATMTLSHGATQLGAVFTPSLQGYVGHYLADDRPPDPRPARVNPTLAEGFRLDQDDFTEAELARDPYYQELLRPLGFGWHACALLEGAPGGDTVNLTLRRTLAQGRFEHEQMQLLDAQLPLVRATARMTQLIGGLAGAPPDSRRALFGFDAKSAAFTIRQDGEASELLSVRAGRLVAHGPGHQRRVQATIERANVQRRQTSCILADASDRWWLFSVTPAAVMVPAALTPFISWASLVPYERSDAAHRERAQALAELFGLSPAEARVAGLIGDAKSVATTARALGASSGTIRNHLKAIFSKVGVRRQAELVAVLARL